VVVVVFAAAAAVVVQLQLGFHPVAVVQYTLTHKQCTEYREQNTHNNYKEKKSWVVNWEVRAMPCLSELYPGICLTSEKKARKTSVRVVKKCPDIPVAVEQSKPWSVVRNVRKYMSSNAV
jgi:hypothetical protein